MPLRVKKSQSASRLGNSQGQAVIEYVLILIISVSLIVALANVMFKPFGEFVSNYMGKYTACLLEYGELPTLGSEQASEADEDSECNKKFQPGTLAAGRPPAPGGAGSGGSSRSNSGRSSESSSSDSSSGGGTYAGSASRNGGRNINTGRRGSRGADSRGARGQGGKVVEITLDGGANGGFFRSNNSSVRLQANKTKYVAITGVNEQEMRKLVRKANGGSRTVATVEGTKRPEKRIPVKKPELAKVVEEESPMTIGNFIRYLFIAALILALIVFIGGQALQMSKSSD